MSATGHRTPASAPPLRRRVTALATAAATAVAGAALVFGAAPAHAMNGPGTPPYWAQSPFSVPSGTGASLPFTEYEAESREHHRHPARARLHPGRRGQRGLRPGSRAAHRVGPVRAVHADQRGQRVRPALHPATRAPPGTLSVYVNGIKLSKELSLTSAYSYISTGGITGSQDAQVLRRRPDDVRPDRTRPAPLCKVQVDSGDSATPYTIDVADFYNVPAAATQPSGSVSVVSEGADPTGAADSTQRLQHRDQRRQRRRTSRSGSRRAPTW